MLRLLKTSAAAALLITCMAPARSAPVAFIGATTGGNALFAAGTPVSLNLDFTPSATATATVTAAMLTIGPETWSVLDVTGGTVSIVENGAANDELEVALTFLPSAPGGLGSGTAGLTLTILGHKDLGPGAVASFENVNMIAMNPSGGNPGTGSLLLAGGEVPGVVLSTTFSGTAVPEPGTVALLSGLGMVFGAGAWRRRRRNLQDA